MKTLYLECSMGAAGNMVMAALLELTNNNKKMLKEINSIGLPNVKVDAKLVVKCGIKGTHVCVKINGIEENSFKKKYIRENHLPTRPDHITIKKIKDVLTQLHISQKVKKDALSIYNLIEKAEASVHTGEHGRHNNNYIHLHEVGSIDAITDIVGVCMLIEHIAPQEIVVSPVNVGGGFAHCSHGSLSVPAPATAYILKDIPIYSDQVNEELCTPTGAAIIKHFATRFEQLPKICIKKIGYGMGTKSFKTANYIRAFLGETENNFHEIYEYEVTQLQCNLDDTTGEAIGFVTDLLLQKGALDVFITPIQMKKNRPAFLLTCMCNKKKANFFAELMLRHTTTFGVRKFFCDRYTLKHRTLTQKTQYGNIRIKIGTGHNIRKSKLEYDDLAKIASSNNITFNEAATLLSNNNKVVKDDY